VILPMTRVLVIADDPWVHNEVAAVLSNASFSFDVETDPEAVTERATATPFDAYVVDLQVSSMGGMAVTRALREAMDLDGVPAAPIVILGDRSADAFLARRAGANAFFAKPLHGVELRAALVPAAAF